ncbi:MAG: winged helix-turn-helix domain-containing protein [Hyphomonadaceae bacterium]
MDGTANDLGLANEPDFMLGSLRVSPSSSRVFAVGRETRIEAKTMAVLVVLARAAGATVTRDALIGMCWDGRVVSDDAVARTIAKVRSVARVAAPPAFTLETVRKVGYRLIAAAAAVEAPAAPTPLAWSLSGARAWLPALGLVAALSATTLLWGAATRAENPSFANTWTAAAPHAPEVADALMTLDEQRLAAYLQQGWNPNWHLDSEGNAALHILMQACERNATHDQHGVVRVARMLVDAGANLTTRNRWGDSPLRIARSPRYCGPDHPVTLYLQSLPT